MDQETQDTSSQQDPDLPEVSHSGAIAWMAKHPVAANLIMIILLAGGFWAAYTVQKEVYPEFLLDVVEVSVQYPGSAPAEVEQGILRPVEEAVRGVDGIREITSEAGEGSGTVTIELVPGAERMQAFQDIDQAVNRITTFPDDIEEPEVRLQSNQREVLSIGIYGDAEIMELRRTAEQVRDQLLNDPNITQVAIGNVPDYMTHIEIPRTVLQEYDLTLGEIAALVGQSSQDIPAGAVETESGEILLRLQERRQIAEEYSRINIITTQDGGTIQLGDIAQIRDGFDEGSGHGQFNRQPTVDISISRIGDQSPLAIEEAAIAVLDRAQQNFPPGVQYRVDSNDAEEYSRRLSLLTENGILAIFIVLLILSLFLEYRLAFWVMMGMSISFIGAMLFLPGLGISINMISMFGFLVVLGIVVDDAIVVGENIYEYRQKGYNFLDAAIAGAREMSKPVTFSILTNIIAFTPLLFMPGTTGKYWWPLPAVVIVVLAVSLFEALFILPAHLAHTKKNGRTKIGDRLFRVQQLFSNKVSEFINTRYRTFLDFCLRNRYITLTSAVTLLFVIGGYGYSDHMGMILMPEQAANEIEAGVRLPVGTTIDQAEVVAARITESTYRLFNENNLFEVAEGIKTNIRGQNFIDVEIVMRPPDERDMTANELIEIWRTGLDQIEGVDQVTFEAERGPGGYQQDIVVDLSHANTSTLEEASLAFMEEVQRFETTRDVSDNFNRGKTQFDYRLLPEAAMLGLTPADVGMQLRDAFFGALALRQLRGTNEVEVRVKLPREERKDLYNLEEFLIETPQGTTVPLPEIAELNRGEAFTSINRRDGRRVVSVGMDAEPANTVGQVLDAIEADILPRLSAEYPGLTWSFEGSQADMRESTQSLWGNFGMALLIIYTLLAIAFRNYSQPLIIMGAIPFGIVGAVIGHILLGYDLSLVSLMGIIALSGVVLNDSIIMVDYANRKRKMQNAYKAIHEAGLRRFRPILLTTLTTFGGLTPIILETSNQARQLIPMAISLGFGIVFATAIILAIVPCLYLILEDVKSGLKVS
ncbi:efflux RND transporter permease subunit [Rhodohalobacter mucosus]|uniref:AcrB/AcrD/AcrF family protein n=1 Tax=Rhodohalobacter mucosus TaxID=2079485 RepID=A0A316U122_9BACT|nr:efflux RND transporter permease subunit [Rhodohalobacter mucosus]PWN06526.1 AcrB/AcrD/AcrF family protein [Rhodohalobacter mucosus]